MPRKTSPAAVLEHDETLVVWPKLQSMLRPSAPASPPVPRPRIGFHS